MRLTVTSPRARARAQALSFSMFVNPASRRCDARSPTTLSRTRTPGARAEGKIKGANSAAVNRPRSSLLARKCTRAIIARCTFAPGAGPGSSHVQFAIIDTRIAGRALLMRARARARTHLRLCATMCSPVSTGELLPVPVPPPPRLRERERARAPYGHCIYARSAMKLCRYAR